MTYNAYTEDTLVQQTTADYLEKELGWESVYAYNNETFVPNPHPQPFSQREKGATQSPLPVGEDLGEGTHLADGKMCLGRTSDREVVVIGQLQPARPEEELLAELKEAIGFVR